MTTPPRRGGSPAIDRPADLSALLQIPFSAEQLAAITAPLEPGVIMAGAGSGKTTVMAARVVWLVGTHVVRPEQVLGLTFTRKAAAELSSRVRQALTRADVVDVHAVDEAGEQLIMTYDAFAARLVADHGARIGVDAEPTMITGASRYRLASRVVAAAAGPFEVLSRLRPRTVTDRVLHLDQQLQQHLISPADLEHHAWRFGQELAGAPRNPRGQVYADLRTVAQRVDERLELASLAAEYAALKRRLGVVEFADQMSVAAELARAVPEVSAQLREAYRVVLLDEYQDTSSAQALLLRALFSGDEGGQGRGHPVTAVGDEFQAIYGWRGAAASNITGFGQDFPRADGSPARRYSLTVNRRSGQRVLDVANVLSEPLRDGPGGSTADGADRLLVAGEGAGEGDVQGATFATWPEEVSWICDQIVTLGPAVPAVHGLAPGQPDARRQPGSPGSDRPVDIPSSPSSTVLPLPTAASRWSDIAVLARRNADVAEIYAQLAARDVPAEIVGLGGLLHLPEVADVIATLRVIDDVTANPDLVRLLTGPRWSIGPSDLALLGQRARSLARAARTEPDNAETTLVGDLAEAVAEVDPTEVVSLADALDDPGDLPYSPPAVQRFARLARELSLLREHADDPVLDLTRRVIGQLGLDVELAATHQLVRVGRRDQLATFVDAVGDYVDVDGDASLSGLLAWVQSEIDSGVGLEQAVPTDQDSVKLLTVHRAKGLEWDVVFVPALVEGTFPSDRVTDNWLRSAAVVPGPLRGDRDAIPAVGTPITMEAYRRYGDALRTQARQAEDRLAYVAVTRARRTLIGTGHQWRPQTTGAKEPSPYLTAILAEAERQGRVVCRAPEAAGTNPLVEQQVPTPWPAAMDPEAARRRREAADWVRQARKADRGGAEARSDPELSPESLDLLAAWDDEAIRLLAEAREARRPRREVALPTVASTTDWMRAAADPQGYAAQLVRPMPVRPSRSARFGTRFHRWVEHHFGGTSLVDLTDLEQADADEITDHELREVCDAFAAGRFGERIPHRLEAPFEYAFAGRTIRGRIDAVYAEPDGHWLVVDWKTTRSRSLDPLQLGIYRLAWASLVGVPEERVSAAFYLVRTDELIEPAGLPSATGLASRLARIWQATPGQEAWPPDGDRR